MRLQFARIAEITSQNGHVIFRVAPGGDSFEVFVRDSSVADGNIIAHYGPFMLLGEFLVHEFLKCLDIRDREEASSIEEFGRPPEVSAGVVTPAGEALYLFYPVYDLGNFEVGGPWPWRGRYRGRWRDSRAEIET